jgi:hypothetical protein
MLKLPWVWGCTVRAAAIIIASFIALLAPVQAHATCGMRGGPGYRGPSGDCVGWVSIARICGCPPATRCTPERVAPGADDAAKLGCKILEMKRRAHHEAGE